MKKVTVVYLVQKNVEVEISDERFEALKDYKREDFIKTVDHVLELADQAIKDGTLDVTESWTGTTIFDDDDNELYDV